MSEREAEVVYFFDRVAPMELARAEEVFIDLSQNIDRSRVSASNTVPCITPNGRLWKCRAKEWLLAPEAMLAQGLDVEYVSCVKEFTHRQIVDLMGNAFNSSSYLVALATALSFTDLSAPRRPCPACNGVHQVPVFERTNFDLEAEIEAIDWSDEDSDSD